nr:transposase domain-containing protein [Streptomyces flaveus]
MDRAGRREKRVRLLPAWAVVYFVLAMCLFFGDGFEDVVACLCRRTDGLTSGGRAGPTIKGQMRSDGCRTEAPWSSSASGMRRSVGAPRGLPRLSSVATRMQRKMDGSGRRSDLRSFVVKLPLDRGHLETGT